MGATIKYVCAVSCTVPARSCYVASSEQIPTSLLSSLLKLDESFLAKSFRSWVLVLGCTPNFARAGALASSLAPGGVLKVLQAIVDELPAPNPGSKADRHSTPARNAPIPKCEPSAALPAPGGRVTG